MQSGFQRGFGSFNLIKDTIKNEVSEFGLEIYTIPPSEYSAASGTIYLPVYAKWLLCGYGSCASGSAFSINTFPVLQNDVSSAIIASFIYDINNNKFNYIKTCTIFNLFAIKLSGGS